MPGGPTGEEDGGIAGGSPRCTDRATVTTGGFDHPPGSQGPSLEAKAENFTALVTDPGGGAGR